jgi:uncharacterized protein
VENLPVWRIAVFLAIVNAISIAVHYYVGSRVMAALPRGAAVSRFVWPAVSGLFLLLVAAMFLSRAAPPTIWTKAIVVGGHVWMGLMFLLLVAGFVGDLVGWWLRLIGWLSSQDLSEATRWTRLALLALAPLAAFHGVVQALRPPLIHEVEIPIPGLAPQWDGLRIAHLTDTHVGPILGQGWIEDLVRRVDSSKPDIVVHTGDLIDGKVEGLREAMAPMGRLRGKVGTYFVTGNHEGYSGIQPWCVQMRAWGWDVLTNEHRLLSRDGFALAVAGITDAREDGQLGGAVPDVARALEGVPAGVPVLLLAHQPRQAFEAAGHGVSLQLSGHTHGGQIWPFGFLVRLQQPMVAGYAKIGGVPVFTSRGAGFWGPPMRIGSRAEVPIVVLRKG